MKFADFSPSSSPSLDQQRDALRKGQGRAMQWAMAGKLEDGPLLEACLLDCRYDTQLEVPRAEWLRGLIREVDSVDRFRVPILSALHELSDARSADQLVGLALYYAESGDDAFRMRLREIVDQNPTADGSRLAEEEVIQLDGEDGFLHVARARARTLAVCEWDWYDDFLVKMVVERFGAGRVEELLGNTRDEAIGIYREAWARCKAAAVGLDLSRTQREKTQEIKLDEILSEAESHQADFGRFQRWGMYASDDDLERVIQHIDAAEDPIVIADLLQVFTKRSFPRFAARFIELALHGDDEVRRKAILAMEQIELPIIREFALAELENGLRGKFVISLFTRNYRPGDEQRILESLEFPDDVWDLHSLLMDVIEVLKHNPYADRSQLGVVAYASTPCEMCRSTSVSLLHEQHVAPGWLTEECRFDSSERTREFVSKIAGLPQAAFE
jgi:hypothetical protein